MSLEKESVQAVATMIPIAVDLVSQLVNVAKRAQADGIDVPSIDRLKDLNQQLMSLEDLAPGSPPDVDGILPELPPDQAG